jgi:hypothetical protein
MRSALPFLAFAHWIAAASGLPAQAPGADAGPTIECEIDHREAGRWSVRVHATRLDPTRRDVALELPDWGEWTALDSDYLQAVRFAPELESFSHIAGSTGGSTGDAARSYRLRLPPDWNGELEAEYTLLHLKAGSPVHDEHPLLPFDTPSYTQAFLINTLMRVLVDGKPLEAKRIVRIRAREGETVATGWNGVSTGSQISELPQAIDNALIVIGELVGHAQDLEGDAPCEVIQFARGPDATGDVLALVRTLLSAYTRNTSRVLDSPARVFLDDPCGGNTGGTRTDRGFVVQFDPREADGSEQPAFRKLVAHELFHNWLGGLIRSTDESMVWFSEGFTEYLALWHLAAEGLASREWFAGELAGMDASIREGDAYGRVAFADPDVEWRDEEGSNEALAYRGGAVLAFHADVALRRAGRPGLPEMITDLIARDGGRLSQRAVLESCAALGLTDFHRLHIAGRELPPLADALASIGFTPRRRDVNLAYLGIESSGGLGVGRVLAIDPEGPAAGTGLQVGDKLCGYFPSRTTGVEIRESVETKYRFGLNRVAVGIEGTYIEAIRESRELKLPLTPRPIPGGFRTEYDASGETLARFFAFRAASGR